jgi:hypothetical protein
MFNRVVSVSSIFVVLLSAMFFLQSAWLTMSGKISQTDGIFMLSGWLAAGLVFAYRASDPNFLEPLSIIKSR